MPEAPKPEAPPTVLTVHLYSFGYKYSGIPQDASSNNGGFVFDCRFLPNPFWDEALRPYSGLEAPVVAFMEAQPEAQEYARHAQWLVLSAARAYAQRGYGRLMVSFGCTGGRHRSVYQAERMAQALRAAGFAVELAHLDVAHVDLAPDPRVKHA